MSSGNKVLGLTVGERTYWVYIMASHRNGTLYIGVTNNLALRAHQHRTGVAPCSRRSTA